MGYTNDYLDAILAKRVSEEWTAEEKAALPAAAKRLDKLREREMMTHAELRALAGGTIVGIKERRPYIDQQLPLNYEPHRKAGGKFHDGKDGIHPKGACIVDSWRTIEGTVARAKDVGDALSYEQPFKRVR